ncbi:hypothetical protein Tco_1543334 [Tanacetum coccineum]
MSQLPTTDRAALDEYMAVCFRAEVQDTVELRSMVVRVRTQQLRENHEEDSAYLEVLNALVDKLCAAVRKEKDVSEIDY